MILLDHSLLYPMHSVMGLIWNPTAFKRGIKGCKNYTSIHTRLRDRRETYLFIIGQISTFIKAVIDM